MAVGREHAAIGLKVKQEFVAKEKGRLPFSCAHLLTLDVAPA
jgi:hypothetical protein